MKNTVLILSTVLAFSSVQGMAETMVVDTDGNGAYSMEELAVSYPDLTAEAFAAIDTDASGEVSVEELAAAVEAGTLAN